MMFCFYCNNELLWQNSEDAEDLRYDLDGDVSFYHCPHCGTDYEVFRPNDKGTSC